MTILKAIKKIQCTWDSMCMYILRKRMDHMTEDKKINKYLFSLRRLTISDRYAKKMLQDVEYYEMPNNQALVFHLDAKIPHIRVYDKMSNKLTGVITIVRNNRTYVFLNARADALAEIAYKFRNRTDLQD